MISSTKRAYLIIGRSEEYQVNQLGYGRQGSLTRVAEAVADSPYFRVVYRNPDATIFTLAPLRSPSLQQVLAENPAKNVPAWRSKPRRKR
jgi:hypothetical protein